MGTVAHLALWGIYGLCIGMGFLQSIVSVERQGIWIFWVVSALLALWQELRLWLLVLLVVLAYGGAWYWMSYRMNAPRPNFHWGIYWYGLQPLLHASFLFIPAWIVRVGITSSEGFVFFRPDTWLGDAS